MFDYVFFIFLIVIVTFLVHDYVPSLRRVKSVYYNNEHDFWRVITLTIFGAEEVWYSHNKIWIRQRDAAKADVKVVKLLDDATKRTTRELVIEHRRQSMEDIEE